MSLSFARRAGVAGLLWIILYALLMVFTRDSEAAAKFVANFVFAAPIALATWLSVVACRRTTGRSRITWRLLAVSNGLWLAGELIWLGYAYRTVDVPSLPSAADGAYLLSYCFALPAIVVGMGGVNPLRQLRGLLDALLVASSFGAVGWSLVIAPLQPGAGSPIFPFIYPVLDVAIVSSLVALGVASRRAIPLPVLVAGAGFAVACISDAGYTYLVVMHSYQDSSWVNLGWQVEAVLLCLAALAALRNPVPAPDDGRLDRDVPVLPAVLAALAVTGLAALDQARHGRLSTSTMMVAVVLLLGLLGRQLLTTSDRTRLTVQLETALREQERLAITDGLTGLYNRRFFQEMMRLEADRAARTATPLSVVMIDLDRFKTINDRYGHPAGDAVLVHAADRVRQALRSTDIVARYGGEEFACLLPGADDEAALELAERVRRGLCRTPVSAGGVVVALTGSVGVATAEASAPIRVEDLIKDADRALYRAKARGRNRTVVAGRLLADPSLDTDPDLPPALVWLADQIDAKLSHHEHSTAVSRWSMLTGQRLGLEHSVLRRLSAAGRLHDIGKINVDDAILAKPGPLTEREWQQLRRHPAEGARLLTDLANRPDLAAVVMAHHERFDGSGYPAGLMSGAIPLEARIIAVCDAWAAMCADRPYTPALSEEAAREQIEQGRGAQFDPVVADAFLSLLDDGTIDRLSTLRPTVSTATG